MAKPINRRFLDKDLEDLLRIAVIGNKIIVSAALNIIVYIDKNQDDIPDKKEILLVDFVGCYQIKEKYRGIGNF